MPSRLDKLASPKEAPCGHYPLPEDEDLRRVRAQVRRGLTKRCRELATQGYYSVADVPSRVAARLDRLVSVGVPPRAWKTIRKAVYERDAGVCHACGSRVSIDNYECSHIVDRCAGGTDRESNLVVMCVVCNRMKPVHSSRAEYVAWVGSKSDPVRRDVAAATGVTMTTNDRAALLLEFAERRRKGRR